MLKSILLDTVSAADCRFKPMNLRPDSDPQRAEIPRTESVRPWIDRRLTAPAAKK